MPSNRDARRSGEEEADAKRSCRPQGIGELLTGSIQLAETTYGSFEGAARRFFPESPNPLAAAGISITFPSALIVTSRT